MNTPTVSAPDCGADYSDTSVYDLLGTHAMRFAGHDVQRIIDAISAARASLPAMARAFRANEAGEFSAAFVAAEADLERALARATSMLADLRAA